MYKRSMMLHLVTVLLTSGCVTFCSQYREYYLIEENMTWYEAQVYCRANYTDLATIGSRDDKTRLDTAAASPPGYALFIWIGLMSAGEASWKWSAGETQNSRELAEYTNWADLPQSNSSCGSVRRDGKWLSAPCETALPFLCQGEGESSWNFILRDQMSWTEAQDYCRQHDKNLISVRSDAENQALQQALNGTAPLLGNWSAVWIGLFRDDWIWSDQSKSALRYWETTHPENNEDCGAYDPISKAMFDIECVYTCPFICYHENIKRHIVTLEIKTNSVFEFSEAAMSDSLLTQIQKQYEGVKLWWRVQPDGKIFHEKETKEIIEGCEEDPV